MPEDFFGRGVAPFASPFTDFMNPKTLSQQRAAQPSWLNVGGVGRGDPFGQNKGDISGAGWENPISVFTRQAEKEMAKLAGAGMTGGAPGQTGPAGTLSGNTPTQYDQAFIDAAKEMSAKYGVNLSPALLKSIAHVETGGQFNFPTRPDDGYGGGPTVGIMQIKPGYWGGLASQIGADIYDPIGNIRTGAAIMAKSMAERGGSWERALTEVYFPGPDVNGTTQSGYVATVNNLMAQYGSMTGGGSYGIGPTKGQFTGGGTGGMSTIFGGQNPPVGYDFDAPSVNGNMYAYSAGLGLSGGTHPALDISVPRGTPLYSPGSGVVSCVGGADAGVGGTGGGSCGYFPDTDGGGIGNITIKLDNGTFVILGHSASASVRPGQRVTAGMPVGSSGGMYGAHTHLEVRVPDPTTSTGYRVVDPRSVLGGGAMGPSYQQTSGNYSAAYGGGSLMGGWNSIWSPDAPWRSYQR